MRHNGPVTATFPHARKGKPGYDVDEVEEFLEAARLAYTSGDPDAAMSAEQIRAVAFTMRKDGYSTTHVDAALERLEDAFALRERERAVADGGDQAWYGTARETAQVLLDRFVRPAGHRFDRVSWFTVGYSTQQVDELADRIAGFFQTGEPISVDAIRTSVFAAQRGGYSERQVDAVLDAVTETMLAVR